MLSHFRTRQAARLGLAALTLALGVVTPFAPTGSVLAQSATNSSCADPGPPDYPVAAGWFYTQEGRGCILGVGPNRRRGYLVQDDLQGAFWTEFRRYGGLGVLGYPVSQRFNYPATNTGGYLYQAFERGILQWHPETGRADLATCDCGLLVLVGRVRKVGKEVGTKGQKPPLEPFVQQANQVFAAV